MKQEQLMICPIKGKCPIIGVGLRCGWQEPHECNRACAIGHNTPACPACIPYEPQPATCPDCGHPVTEHGEYGCRETHKADDTIYEYCECEKTPTDLQPEKHLICLCMDDGCGFANPYCPIHGEQPTQMPLREQFEEVIDKIISWELDRNVDDAITQRKVMLERIYSIIPAHDSEVAVKAVKEFAAKVAKEMVDIETAEGCRRYIRAMAEEKE